MPLRPTRLQLAKALHRAGHLHFVKARYLDELYVVFHFEWQGKPISFTVQIHEVIDGQLPNRPLTTDDNMRPALQTYGSALSRLSGKSVDWLKAEGLPLYNNKEWLLEALRKHGTQAAISKEYGYSNQAVSEACQRHGIHLRPRIPSDAVDRAREMFARGTRLSEISATLKISVAVTRRLRRAWQEEQNRQT